MPIGLAYSDFVKDLLDQSIKRQVPMIEFIVPFADLVPHLKDGEVEYNVIACTMLPDIKEVVAKKKYIHVNCNICPLLHDSQLTLKNDLVDPLKCSYTFRESSKSRTSGTSHVRFISNSMQF